MKKLADLNILKTLYIFYHLNSFKIVYAGFSL